MEDKQILDKAFYLFSIGKFNESEIIMRDLIKSNPIIADYHSKLGLILLKLGRFKEAEQSTLKALELQPDLEKACLNLLLILESQGKYDEAINQADYFLRKNPTSLKVPHFLARIYLDIGKINKAELTIKKLILKEPSLMLPTIILGKILDKKANLNANIFEF